MPMVTNVKLEEMDFGDFEYKNYHELNGNAAYQAWIDSGGTDCLPKWGGQGTIQQTLCRRILGVPGGL